MPKGGSGITLVEHAGDFDSDWECGYNPENDTYDRRQPRVTCPNCGRVCSPMLSPSRRTACGGWRWVGLSYQEPYTVFEARCPGCCNLYAFTIHSPQ